VFVTLYVTTLREIKVITNTFCFTRYKLWIKKWKAKWLKTKQQKENQKNSVQWNWRELCFLFHGVSQDLFYFYYESAEQSK